MRLQPRVPGELLHDRDFRLYWLARMASTGGSVATLVAMPILVYRLTGSAGLTGLVSVLEALPYLMLGLLAGVVADRRDRKTLMVAADLANAVVIGSVPLAHFLGVLTVGHVLVAAFLAQALYTFFDSANYGALPVLVGSERVGSANAALWGPACLIEFVTPTLVAVLLTVVHPADVLLVDALSFLASALLLRSVVRALSAERAATLRRGGRALQRVLADAGEGARFLWRHPGLRTTTVMGTLQSVAGAGWVALWVPWVDRELGLGTSGWRFGLVFAVWGIGGVMAAMATPYLLRRVGAERLVLVLMSCSGLAGVLVSLTTHWVETVVLVIVWGTTYQGALITTLTYRQVATAEHLLSRVNTAARMLSWGVGWTLGGLLAAALAEVIGVRSALTVVVTAGLVAAIYGWCSPLRRVDAAARPATAHD